MRCIMYNEWLSVKGNTFLIRKSKKDVIIFSKTSKLKFLKKRRSTVGPTLIKASIWKGEKFKNQTFLVSTSDVLNRRSFPRSPIVTRDFFVGAKFEEEILCCAY